MTTNRRLKGEFRQIETGIDAYANVVKPDGAANWKATSSVNLLLP